jgi:hypothetical protein
MIWLQKKSSVAAEIARKFIEKPPEVLSTCD